jgi:outer membrane protein insertion porin family
MKSTRILQIGVSLVYLAVLFPAFIVPPPSCSETTALQTETVSQSFVSLIVIDIRNFPHDAVKLKEMARNLIFLNEGDAFSDARLRDSINALKLSKKFREIHVDSKEEEAGTIALFFRLIPLRQIKDITIDGQYPLFEREVLNIMTMYTGDAFIREDLHHQTDLITTLYKRYGFTEPKVEVRPTENAEDGTVLIHVTITKDTYYSLDNLEITGNPAFSDGKLKLKMKSWRASLRPGSLGRFIEDDFKKDIKNLTSFYRNKGYADVVIDHVIEKNPETGSVSASVKIDEGPRYDVGFAGNKAFWTRTLKKDLVLFESGNKNDLGLKKTIRKIKDRYRKAGYLEASITIVEETKPEEQQMLRVIRLDIHEGPRSTVRSLEIEGNKALDEEKIKKQMLTRPPGFMEKGVYVPEELEEDIFVIKSLYAREGYSDTVITHTVHWSEDKKNVDIKLTIIEGFQTIVSSVEIVGATVLKKEDAYGAIMLKDGEPFRKYLIRSDKNALAHIISEKGHPHVQVQDDTTISEDKSKAKIIYRIEEGASVTMGKVYFTGNFRTKEKILRNELELKEGDPFSLAKLLQDQRNIRNMNSFDNVRFKTIGLKEKADTVNLIAEVAEKKPYFFELGSGYESDRGFFAQTKAGDRNLLGTNKYGWIGGKISQIGWRGDLGLTEPRLFGTRTVMSLNFFAEQAEDFNQDFGTRSYGTSIGFSRRWLRSFTAGLTFRFEQRDQYPLDSADPVISSGSEDQFQSRSILVTTPSLMYDTRDSFIRPRKGLFSFLSVDVSTGLRNSLDNFLKYRFDARYYVTPFNRLTIASLGRAGYISAYGSGGTIPMDQLFFLGGTSDVRGFDENLLRLDETGNPVGGKTTLSGSIEARIDLGHNVELAPFVDTGVIRNTFDESGSDSFRSSVGLGLRYITPIGPIGLLYGHKLDRKEGENAGRFHFSIGYTF